MPENREKKYTVFLFPMVAVKVTGVKASSPLAAARKASEDYFLDMEELFKRQFQNSGSGIQGTEFVNRYAEFYVEDPDNPDKGNWWLTSGLHYRKKQTSKK